METEQASITSFVEMTEKTNDDDDEDDIYDEYLVFNLELDIYSYICLLHTKDHWV